MWASKNPTFGALNNEIANTLSSRSMEVGMDPVWEVGRWRLLPLLLNFWCRTLPKIWQQRPKSARIFEFSQIQDLWTVLGHLKNWSCRRMILAGNLVIGLAKLWILKIHTGKNQGWFLADFRPFYRPTVGPNWPKVTKWLTCVKHALRAYSALRALLGGGKGQNRYFGGSSIFYKGRPICHFGLHGATLWSTRELWQGLRPKSALRTLLATNVGR